jgi:hypothetical protein
VSAVLELVRPRICHFPEVGSSAGREVIDLAAEAGLHLDPWQAFALERGLTEDEAGKWAAFEVGCIVPRQNGKGGIIEARELGGLFILDEAFIVHSAHQFDTSLEAFRRLLFLIENTPYLSKRVKRVSRSHGEEGIELMNRQRIRFRTRTAGGGRGFSGDCLIYDEAMILKSSSHSATLPVLSARPNPQVWYFGSAVDQDVHEHGVVFARLRERGARGEDGIAVFEWSAAPEGVELDPSNLPVGLADDPEAWERANPALGIRIPASYIDKERRSMDPRSFAVERLGIGDWPATDEDADSVIPISAWRDLADPDSSIVSDLRFAFDAPPDRGSAAIVAAGRRADGLLHVEVIDRRNGLRWLLERLPELMRHQPASILCDGNSPVASLVGELATLGVAVETVSAPELARACGNFYDSVMTAGLRHLGSAELDAAIRGAARRPLVDAWAWSRKNSKVDISPLVAATLAADLYAPTPFLII